MVDDVDKGHRMARPDSGNGKWKTLRVRSRALIPLWLIAGLVMCMNDANGAPRRRAVYVRDASELTTRLSERARLGRLIDEKRITDVVPYGLGSLLATRAGRTTVATWFGELHRRGARVVVPIAGADRLTALDELLAEHPRTWIDGLITELEFWNRPDRIDAFGELIALIAGLRIRSAVWARPGHTVSIGAYLGYPTASEAATLATVIDFVFLDYSVRTPAAAWNHVHPKGGALRDRFAWFAMAALEIWPIFYAAGEVDMHASLAASGTSAAERRLLEDLAADRELRSYSVTGFTYFTFEAMPDPR